MYQKQITTSEEALSHLFFHCCLQDGEYTEDELRLLSEKIVVGGLNEHLNFKEEIIKYRAYYNDITDDTEYVQFLLQVIKPVKKLALYSYCVELCLSDSILSVEEEELLQTIGTSLNLDDAEQTIIKTVMVQRKLVATKKVF